MEKVIPKLSSSKLELLENCSWSFYARYFLKIPQKGNSGSLRGTCVHSVLDFLAKPKRVTWIKEITDVKDAYFKKSLEIYIKKYIAKWSLTEDDEILIKTMILVALNHDFLFQDLPNSKMLQTELKFDWVNENPRYSITGFIDRPVLYDDNRVMARDFKGSKAKYNPNYLYGATQGFMYSLALTKLYPERKPTVEFLFLRFPKKPVQTFETTPKRLRGFEFYLEEVTKFIEDFTEVKAKGNFAKNNPEKRWLCGKEGSNFCCEARKPLDYWVIIDDNKIVKGAFTREELEKILKTNQSIEAKHYPGCPAWYKPKPKFRHPDENF